MVIPNYTAADYPYHSETTRGTVNPARSRVMRRRMREGGGTKSRLCTGARALWPDARLKAACDEPCHRPTSDEYLGLASGVGGIGAQNARAAATELPRSADVGSRVQAGPRYVWVLRASGPKSLGRHHLAVCYGGSRAGCRLGLSGAGSRGRRARRRWPKQQLISRSRAAARRACRLSPLLGTANNYLYNVIANVLY